MVDGMFFVSASLSDSLSDNGRYVCKYAVSNR